MNLNATRSQWACRHRAIGVVMVAIAFCLIIRRAGRG
jgi:hypothetical protein